MFGLFSRKSKLAPATVLPISLPPEAAVPPGRPAQLAARLLLQFLRTQGFLGSFDALPGVSMVAMTDGIFCLRDPDHLIGGILTNGSAALHITGAEAGQFAHQTLTAVIGGTCGLSPDWWQAVSDAWTCSLRLGPTMMIDITVENTEVDPLFSGLGLPGLTLTVAARRAD